MNRTPMTVETPEEVELQQKLVELARLESELAESELDLATVGAELQAFERLYIRVVGAKYAELDKIAAEIQGLLLARSPVDPDLQAQAHDTQERARQSEQATAGAGGASEKERFRPSEELKRIYREVAKNVHPDLAGDPKEQERRNRVMAEVNRAYAEGDIDRLRCLLREWETSPEAIQGEGVGERLVRTIRKIHQARARLDRIGQEIDDLRSCDLARLRGAVVDAERQGRNLLAEMARSLEDEIELARNALGELRASMRGS